MPDTDILTIKQLAEYLMVSEKTVYRMLDRQELPAVRVGAQWRFRKSDIDAWLEGAVRRVEVIDAGLDIAPLLAPENVWLHIAPASRDDLLRFLATNAALDDHVDREQLFRALREREAICSTALVRDAAFPHPVDPRPFRFTKKRVLLATLQHPIEFADPHGHQPRVVAAILARSMQGHMLAFSRALKLFADDNLVDALATAKSHVEAIGIVAEAEGKLAQGNGA